jgi:hypothetical protein
MHTAQKIETNILQIHCTENSKQIFPEMNLRVSFLISAFIYLRAVYKCPRSVHLFCCIAFADQSCEYINHSQIHELGTRPRFYTL